MLSFTIYNLLDPDSFMTDFAKWMYVGMAIFSFPLLIPVGRSAISNLIPFHVNPSTSTTILLLSSSVISLFIKDLSVVRF